MVVHESDEAGMHEGTSEPFSALAKTVMIAPAVLILLHAILSGSAVILVTSFAAGLPLAFSMQYIRRLSGHSLSKSLLIEQVFFGGLGSLCAAAVLLTVYAMCTLLGAPTVITLDNARSFVRSHITAVAVAGTLVAFGLRAGVCEFIKLAVALRRRARLDTCNARGVAAAAVSGALGLAGAEHFAITFGLMTRAGANAPKVAVAGAVSVLVAAVSFPVHMATALVMGAALARHIVLGDKKTSVVGAYVLAVLLAGSFNALGVACGLLLLMREMKPWIAVALSVAEFAISALLLFVCRTCMRKVDEGSYVLLGGADDSDEV